MPRATGMCWNTMKECTRSNVSSSPESVSSERTSRTSTPRSRQLRSASASIDELIYLLRAFLDADAEMRKSPHPRVELEIAAVRATRRPVTWSFRIRLTTRPRSPLVRGRPAGRREIPASREGPGRLW